MAFTPSTEVYLLNVPLVNDGASTLTFSSESAQSSYFLSKLVNSLKETDFTYQRKDSIIRVPWNAEKLWDVNYCMYRNENYGNKWFYAFVTEVEYVAPQTTFLHIKTDVWQTWFFDVTIGQCYVEREHVNDDSKGKNLIPESVAPSDYNLQKLGIDESPFAIGGYILATTLDNDYTVEKPKFSGGLKANGVYFPCNILIFKASEIANLQAKIASINDLVTNGVVYVTTVPKMVVDALTEGEKGQVASEAYTTYTTLDLSIDHENISGYVPKNNKCFNYPYHFLVASNSANGGSEYRFEDFKDSKNIQFTMYGHITENNCIQFVPNNYNVGGTVGDNPDYGFCSQTYPSQPYISNQNAYYRQQEMALRNSNYNSIVTSALKSVGNIANMGASMLSSGVNPLGAESSLVSGLTSGLSLHSQVESAEQAEENLAKMHDITSPQAQGIGGASDIAVLNGNIAPRFYIKNAKYEQIRAIDEYFNVYGYRVNRAKKPNVTGRPNWNYVKCALVNLKGKVPQSDLVELKATLKNGITFWHNPSTIYDYSETNK